MRNIGTGSGANTTRCCARWPNDWVLSPGNTGLGGRWAAAGPAVSLNVLVPEPGSWTDVTKQELAQKVASDAGLNGPDAKAAVDAAFDAITAELAAGGDAAVAGFGKFSVTNRSAREGRNPATGEAIQIAASKAAKFSAGAALKKTLNAR